MLVGPGLAMGVEAIEGSPAGSEGLQEGIIERGVKIADNDQGLVWVCGCLPVKELAEGGDFSDALKAGFGITGICGIAAFQMDMKETEAGLPE